MKTLVDAFVVPTADLHGVNLELLFKQHFPGARVNVQIDILAFLDCSTVGMSEPFVCKVHKVTKNLADKENKRDLFRLLVGGDRKQGRKLNADQMFGILASLAIEKHHLLEIPLGQERINIVLEGYVTVCGGSHLLLIEHEIEKGEELIDIHLCSLNHEENGHVTSIEIL